jgi:hypothetical protein
MAIKGILSDYSLAEVFKLLEQGNKTGQLVLFARNDGKWVTDGTSYYIWFRQGRIVGAADRNDRLGLATLITQRNWLSTHIINTMVASCPIDLPLGICLKSKNLLDPEQLKILFYVQVMQQVCNLFRLPDANFEFEPNITLPMAEMTGLSSPGTEVTLAGLRALKDWSMLAEKLPDITSALISNKQGESRLNFNKIESQVWQYCNKQIALKTIAQELNLPNEQIQRVAFRLIAVNLAEELPMVALTIKHDQKILDFDTVVVEEEKVSTSKQPSKSLLNSLLNFLQKKS